MVKWAVYHLKDEERILFHVYLEKQAAEKYGRLLETRNGWRIAIEPVVIPKKQKPSGIPSASLASIGEAISEHLQEKSDEAF